MTRTERDAKALRADAAKWRRAAQRRTARLTVEGEMAIQLSKLCDKLATEMLLREALLGLVLSGNAK